MMEKLMTIQNYKRGEADLAAEESGSIEVIVPFINLKPKRPEASCITANALGLGGVIKMFKFKVQKKCLIFQ